MKGTQPSSPIAVKTGVLRSTGSGIYQRGSPVSPDSSGSMFRSVSASPSLSNSDDGKEWENASVPNSEGPELKQMQRTRSETSLANSNNGQGASSPKPSSRMSMRSPAPVSHRLAKKNDVEGLIKEVEERGLWKGKLLTVPRRQGSMLRKGCAQYWVN